MAQPSPLVSLPLRSKRGVPKWDDANRDSVECYFEDLQRLFEKYAVHSDADRKAAALQYVPTSVSRAWKSYTEYSDATKMYHNFTEKVLSFYVGSNDQHSFSIHDLDALVSE